MSCIKRFLRRLFGMEKIENKFVVSEMDKVFEKLQSGAHDYYSLSSLSGSSGIAPERLEAQLEGDKRIRTSIIKDEKGHPLYTLNSRTGLFKDVWNAVRYTTYLKSE